MIAQSPWTGLKSPLSHSNPIPLTPQAIARSPTTSSELTPDQALQRLITGNHRFVNRTATSPNQSISRLTEIADQQQPFATILGCSDSRVPLEIIFDQGLGDIFVIRVAGNVVTPVEMASIEYGNAVLGTKVLMVLGHAGCGAVGATLKGGHLPGQLGSLIEAIQPAVARSRDQEGNALENAAQANVFLQMERLLTSPIVAQSVHNGQLKLVGGYYHLQSGVVSILSVYPCQQSPAVLPMKPFCEGFMKRSEKLSALAIRYVNLFSK